MEKMICPYCESKVNMADVEGDDGTCPECGAPLMGSLAYANGDIDDDDDPYEEGEGHLAALNEDDEEPDEEDLDLDDE